MYFSQDLAFYFDLFGSKYFCTMDGSRTYCVFVLKLMVRDYSVECTYRMSKFTIYITFVNLYYETTQSLPQLVDKWPLRIFTGPVDRPV